jgi:hypothetical protein
LHKHLPFLYLFAFFFTQASKTIHESPPRPDAPTSPSDDDEDDRPLQRTNTSKAMWDTMSTGKEVVEKFWSDVDSRFLPPRRQEAIHPFRKLYARFKAPAPNKVKLASYLVFLALDHPMMLFYGLGIFAAKKMARDLRDTPSTTLLEACKVCFIGLQQSFPQYFGKDPKVFAFKQVSNLIKHLFRKPSAVKAKGTSSADDIKVDELCILSCIAGYVSTSTHTFMCLFAYYCASAGT